MTVKESILVYVVFFALMALLGNGLMFLVRYYGNL